MADLSQTALILMADLGAVRYTADAMVAAARDAGLIGTRRLLRDWVQRGLLDSPKKVGLGRGRGTEATWSDNQRRLWLTLLRGRLSGATLTQLYNVPVWLWLQMGDDHVPERQVRRALARWGHDVTHQAFGPAERAAAAVARKVAGPGSKRGVRKRLGGVLADIVSGYPPEEDATLESAAREVIDPARTRNPRGPQGAPLSPQGYVGLVRARLAAIAQLAGIDGDAFRLAREFYRLASADYVAVQPTLSMDPDLGTWFDARTLEVEVDSACVDFMTILGLPLVKASN
jgi:hypothetical protein